MKGVPQLICYCVVRVCDRDEVAKILDVDEVTDGMRLPCVSSY